MNPDLTRILFKFSTWFSFFKIYNMEYTCNTRIKKFVLYIERHGS